MVIGAGLIFVLILVLVSEIINGWTDAPNAIATVVATRVLKPKWAIILAPVGNIIGAFFGTAVAKTIGTGIVKPEMIDLHTIAAAMISIILWGVTAWRLSLPISKSHALVAGLAGAGFASGGLPALLWSGWEKVLIGLLISSIVGLTGGYLVAWTIRLTCNKVPRTRAQKVFGFLQILSAGGMAFSHGSNDGQKFIGMFTLALVLSGVLPSFRVLPWVIIVCSLTMGLGTSIGGWRIIKTMGEKMVRLEPYQGFSAESAATAAITLASHYGVPLSTTHTINTSIMGVGAATRFSEVHWGTVKEMVTAWLLTFPICGALGFLAGTLFKVIF